MTLCGAAIIAAPLEFVYCQGTIGSAKKLMPIFVRRGPCDSPAVVSFRGTEKVYPDIAGDGAALTPALSRWEREKTYSGSRPSRAGGARSLA